MENKLIFEVQFEERVELVSITDKFEECTLNFNNGYSITTSHDRQCTEKVYADWDSYKEDYLLDNMNGLEREFIEIRIKSVEKMGFLLNDQLINCYNEQNGCYDDELTLTIKDNSGKILFSENISQCNKTTISH